MARGTQVDARSSTHSFLPHCVSAALPPLAKQGQLPCHVGDSLPAGPWAQGSQRHFQMLLWFYETLAVSLGMSALPLGTRISNSAKPRAV